MQVTDAMVAKALKAYDAAVPEDHGASANGMEAALTAALAEIWQDIEDAPKDGSPILTAGGTYYNSMSLFNEDYPFEGQTIAKWDDYHRQWRGENSGGHDEYFWHKPTHFMPLPAPPKTGGE